MSIRKCLWYSGFFHRVQLKLMMMTMMMIILHIEVLSTFIVSFAHHLMLCALNHHSFIKSGAGQTQSAFHAPNDRGDDGWGGHRIELWRYSIHRASCPLASNGGSQFPLWIPFDYKKKTQKDLIDSYTVWIIRIVSSSSSNIVIFPLYPFDLLG